VVDIDISNSPPSGLAIQSFSLTFDDEPYLTLSGSSSDLPPGWTSNFNGNTFTGQNVSGTDLPVPNGSAFSYGTTLGTLTLTISPNAPDTLLNLPELTTGTFTDSQGNSIPGVALFRVGVFVTSPEPPVFFLLLASLPVLLGLRHGQIRRALGQFGQALRVL